MLGCRDVLLDRCLLSFHVDYWVDFYEILNNIAYTSYIAYKHVAYIYSIPTRMRLPGAYVMNIWREARAGR